MAQFSLRLSRKDFITFVLNEFEKDVKNKAYNKMDYAIWRTLKAWATEKSFEGMDFKIQRGDRYSNYKEIPFISIGLSSINKIVPSPHYFDILPNDNRSFGSWLKTHWDGLCYCDRDMIEEFEKIIRETPITYEYTQPSISTTDYKTACFKFNEASSNQLAVSKISLNDSIDNLTKSLNEIIEKTSSNEKEKKDMKFGNFDFGPVDSSVRMSLYGMAIKNASGTYVAYDTKSKQIMDVDILNFEGTNKFMYKMPVAIKDVRSGDVVIHARRPMFVQVVAADGRLKVLDIYDGEEKTIVPARSPFGFDFATKVVSFIDFSTADNSNPFGNMLPFLMLSDNKNVDEMLPLMMMANGGMDMSNPLMLYALCGNGTMDNTALMLAMMMGAMNKPTHSCACGCHEDCDKEG